MQHLSTYVTLLASTLIILSKICLRKGVPNVIVTKIVFIQIFIHKYFDEFISVEAWNFDFKVNVNLFSNDTEII